MPLIEVIVLVPEERVGDFYRVVGAWMGGEERAPAEAASGKRRRSRGAGDGAPLTLTASSRYAPLNAHLAAIPASTKTYDLPFKKITEVMGAPLPKSAYDHRAWWANTETHTQALAWIAAGWKVEGVDLEKQSIHLVRSAR